MRATKDRVRVGDRAPRDKASETRVQVEIPKSGRKVRMSVTPQVLQRESVFKIVRKATRPPYSLIFTTPLAFYYLILLCKNRRVRRAALDYLKK